MLFVSSENLPGLKAITLFAQTVWPEVLRASGAKAELKVLGKVCNLIEPGQLGPNIEPVGLVPDLKPFYEAATIVINPSDFGGGLKIKNVEALCHGKPLLTTSVGAEDLETGTNRAFFICNTPEEFRERLVALILDPAQRKELSERALEFARSQFAPEAAYGELMRVLNARNPSSLRPLHDRTPGRP